jgi:signal transduction histidine kinase
VNVSPVRVVYAAYLGAAALSAVTYAGSAVYALRFARDRGPAARLYGAAMASGTALMLVVLARLLVQAEATKVTLWHARYPFLWAFVGLIAVSSLFYVDRGHLLTRRRAAGLVVGYLVMTAVTVSDPVVDAWTMYTGFETVETPFPHLEPTGQGSDYLFVTGTVYTLFGASLTASTRYLLRSRRGNRRLQWLLVGLVTLPLGAYTLRSLGAFPVRGFEYVLVVTAVVMGVTGYVLFTDRLTRADPVRLDDVVDSVPEGIVVVDDGRVVEYNDIAVDLLPALADGFGAALEERVPELVADDPDAGDGRVTLRDAVTVYAGDDRRTLVLDRTEMDDDRAVVVLRDVTAQERRAEQLRRQTEQLDAFASTVSHDLRNPLTVARGHVSTMGEEESTDDRETVTVPVDSLDAVEESLDRAFGIIDDSLTLARTGRAIEERTTVPLAAVARDAWGTVDTGGATLDLDCDRAVYADRDRLRTLFENLFRNAVEHGGPDVTVRVRAGESGVAVADDGGGFDGDPATVFERGYTTAAEGTGLGLAIVESVAEAHGWTVRARDDDGARFEFEDVDLLGESAATDGTDGQRVTVEDGERDGSAPDGLAPGRE